MFGVLNIRHLQRFQGKSGKIIKIFLNGTLMKKQYSMRKKDSGIQFFNLKKKLQNAYFNRDLLEFVISFKIIYRLLLYDEK